MALTDGQFQIRTLVMGTGTIYRIMGQTNPFVRNVRADQGGPRAWNHGSWSGAEWQAEAVVPFRILIETPSKDAGSWLAAHQVLAAAFQPVGDTAADVELRFAQGGVEYLMFGRPRMVDPGTMLIGGGQSFTRAAFIALDPRIYSGALATHAGVTLPSFTGGLQVPFGVPFTVESVRVGGEASLTNAGTAETGLVLRIDGPVDQPRVSLQTPSGSVFTLRFLLDLPAGQWLEIDTAARTVFLNGLPEANRRGRTVAVPDWPLLPPGTSTLIFDAADRESGGLLSVSYRSAWF